MDAQTKFCRLRDAIEQSGAEFFRMALWQDGAYFAHEFLPMSACSNLYSISKVLTSTGVGLAYDEGLLKLEDPIVKYLGNHVPEEADPKIREVTVRHLLTQTSGIGQGSLFEADRYLGTGEDWIARVLGRAMPHQPGTVFTYDNGNYYMLSCIVEKVTELPLDRFLKTTLFRRMGIREFAWERCPLEHTMGATGCYMGLEDLNKIGRLYALGGSYEGRQLLSREWVEMAAAPYPNTSGTPYGFGFSRRPSGDFFCGGAHNQFLYISLAQKIAVAIQGYDDTQQMDQLIEQAIGD